MTIKLLQNYLQKGNSHKLIYVLSSVIIIPISKTIFNNNFKIKCLTEFPDFFTMALWGFIFAFDLQLH